MEIHIVVKFQTINENSFAITDGSTIGNVLALNLPSMVIMVDTGGNINVIREFRKIIEERTNLRPKEMIPMKMS